MLKPRVSCPPYFPNFQPPSGGCVLKLIFLLIIKTTEKPAAFRRLCVETYHHLYNAHHSHPAAFRRLCVETKSDWPSPSPEALPAAFRRLCVETASPAYSAAHFPPAAFRRLCVETPKSLRCKPAFVPSRLQAAVC